MSKRSLRRCLYSAMSIVAKCMQLSFLFVWGLGKDFNLYLIYYGAKKFQRVKQGILFTWGFSSLVIAVLSIASFIFAPELIHFFRPRCSNFKHRCIGTENFLCGSIIFTNCIDCQYDFPKYWVIVGRQRF